MDEFENIRRILDGCAEDVAKAEGGNKMAGTRVRKAMQEVRAAAQDVRKKILDMRTQEH